MAASTLPRSEPTGRGSGRRGRPSHAASTSAKYAGSTPTATRSPRTLAGERQRRAGAGARRAGRPAQPRGRAGTGRRPGRSGTPTGRRPCTVPCRGTRRRRRGRRTTRWRAAVPSGTCRRRTSSARGTGTPSRGNPAGHVPHQATPAGRRRGGQERAPVPRLPVRLGDAERHLPEPGKGRRDPVGAGRVEPPTAAPRPGRRRRGPPRWRPRPRGGRGARRRSPGHGGTAVETRHHGGLHVDHAGGRRRARASAVATGRW